MSNPALRKRHEVVERALMPFRAEGIDIKDLAADEEAKEAWKRIRGSNMELPCILVDGQRAGVSLAVLVPHAQAQGQRADAAYRLRQSIEELENGVASVFFFVCEIVRRTRLIVILAAIENGEVRSTQHSLTRLLSQCLSN